MDSNLKQTEQQKKSKLFQVPTHSESDFNIFFPFHYYLCLRQILPLIFGFDPYNLGYNYKY